MMMQSNSKEIEVKNNGIDLTETGTISKPVKLDYPFHPDSQAYWLWEVPEDEKLRILLEKCNQFETYYKFFSLEHIVETIFKSSEYRFKKKKEDIENHLELLPNRKEQIIDDEKLKVYNEIKEWKLVSSGNEPHDNCLLDLERSKEIFIEHTFLSLGFKSVKEIENYILSLIAYRGNLLYINYLKQLSAPTATKTNEKVKEIKDISKANDKDRRIGNRFEELMITHKDKKTVLAIIGRQTDLEVGNETSTEKDKTDSIRRTLRKYGIIK